MPQGNAHVTPPGLWYQEPKPSSYRKLFFKSCRNVLAFSVIVTCLQQYRSLSWNYTYKSFIGRTMSLGKLTVLDHEPLSAEEIDRLKKEQQERREVE